MIEAALYFVLIQREDTARPAAHDGDSRISIM